jgi:hypothetical protein
MSAKDVFDLVLGAIEVIEISIEIYKAVQDKAGIPEKLRKVSGKLPFLLEIFRDAEAQYKAGQPDEKAWITARSDVKHCEEACKDLQSLLQSTYPRADANKVDRFFKGAETVLSGKGAHRHLRASEAIDRSSNPHEHHFAEIYQEDNRRDLPQIRYHAEQYTWDKRSWRTELQQHRFRPSD